MSNRDYATLCTIRDALDPDGIARFNAGRYKATGVKTPTRSALKSLTEEKYIEVESHNVTTWLFGPAALPYNVPRLNYNGRYNRPPTPAEQALIDDHDRKVGIPEKPQWEDRTEVWVRITPRGMEYLETLALVD